MKSFALAGKRVETRLLVHHEDGEWAGYSYEWNDAQTDADLVPATGAEVELTSRDVEAPGGVRKQTWQFSGRGACFQCHNPWAGTTLAFTLEQLDRGDQLAALRRMGLLTPVDRKGEPKSAEAHAGSRTAAAPKHGGGFSWSCAMSRMPWLYAGAFTNHAVAATSATTSIAPSELHRVTRAGRDVSTFQPRTGSSTKRFVSQASTKHRASRATRW